MFCFTLTQTENNSSFCFFFTDYAVFFNNTTLRLSARARDITIKKLNSFFWHFLINLPIRSTSDVFSARGAEKTSTRLPLCIRREVLYTFAAWLHVVEKLSNRRKQRKKIMIDKVSKQQLSESCSSSQKSNKTLGILVPGNLSNPRNLTSWLMRRENKDFCNKKLVHFFPSHCPVGSQMFKKHVRPRG